MNAIDRKATDQDPATAVQKNVCDGLTLGLDSDSIVVDTTPGSFGERAQSHSERSGSCIFGGWA